MPQQRSAILMVFMQPLMQFSSTGHHVSFDPAILQPLQTKSDLNWFNTTDSEPNQNTELEVECVVEGSFFSPKLRLELNQRYSVIRSPWMKEPRRRFSSFIPIYQMKMEKFLKSFGFGSTYDLSSDEPACIIETTAAILLLRLIWYLPLRWSAITGVRAWI